MRGEGSDEALSKGCVRVKAKISATLRQMKEKGEKEREGCLFGETGE